MAVAHLEDSHRVGRHREEGGVAERKDAGVPEQQVYGQGEQPEDQDLYYQAGPEKVQEKRGEHRHSGSAGKQGRAAHAHRLSLPAEEAAGPE